MIRKLAGWCSAAAIGVAVGAVSGLEPPRVVVDDSKFPPVSTSAGQVESLPAAGFMQGTAPFNHDSSCECEACRPHYVFPHRACGGSLFFRPDGHWNTVAKPKLQDSHWGYCDQFCERPFGVAVTGHFQRQIINGLGQQMLLYEYDFQDTTLETLSLRGRYQLEKIAQRSQQGLGPIVIASAGINEQLDMARRQSVELELRKLGIHVAEGQVVVRRQPRSTVNAYESQLIQRNREQGVQLRGVGGLSGAASTPSGSTSSTGS